MRAFRRVFAAPLIIAAATLPAIPVHAAPAHHSVAFAPRACPNGTNWDNILQRCV
jgi:hypothetical protein